MFWWQIVQQIIGYLWLFAVLLLLWRHALGGNKRAQKAMQSLVDIAEKNAESTRITAEAARTLATQIVSTHDHS